MGIQHVLAWYSKDGDELVGECPISFEQMKEAFPPPATDALMILDYQVTDKPALILSKSLNMSINLNEFDYFVECHTGGGK